MEEKKKKRKRQAFNADEFGLLVKGLATFYEKEGHWLVPFKFQVPGGVESQKMPAPEQAGWPVETHGLALGRRFQPYACIFAHGHVQNERILGPLRAIGFPVENWREYVWKTATMPALETFKALYGHLVVRRSFVVPYGDARWPRATWGYSLGRKVSKTRSRKQKLSHNEELDLVSVGFIWDRRTNYWEEVILPAFETFHRLHGHTNVPFVFVVPSESPWPQATWELQLGYLTNNMRSRGDFADQIAQDKERWDHLGFDWNPKGTRWKKVILPAFETFHRLHGHTNVPSAFVVPSESPWPQATWELHLGHVTNSIRSQGSFADLIEQDKERWDHLGFDWDPKGTRWKKVILPAFETFRRLHGHTNVPSAFVVPSESPWPQAAWELKLGQVSQHVRHGRTFKERRQEDAERWNKLQFRMTKSE